MKRRIFRLMAVSMMLIGLTVLLVPSVGQAITINSVSVLIPGGTLLPNPIDIWQYPIVLTPGQSALLSQTGTTPNSYNFDTSDYCISPAACGTPVITVNTDAGIFVYTDATHVLSTPVVDNATDPPLETREYVQATGGSPLLALFVGYADDAHLQAPHTTCAPNPNDTGGDCRPDPFSGSGGANQFQATLISGGCLGSVDPCIDAGVLRFVAQDVPKVPEPSTLLLLGAGLVGLAAWGRKRMQS